MPHGAKGRDAAASERAAVHDRSVQLMSAGAIEHGSFAGIEQRIVFQEADDLLPGVKTRSLLFQNLDSNLEHFGQRRLDCFGVLSRRTTRASMDGNRKPPFGW